MNEQRTESRSSPVFAEVTRRTVLFIFTVPKIYVFVFPDVSRRNFTVRFVKIAPKRRYYYVIAFFCRVSILRRPYFHRSLRRSVKLFPKRVYIIN